MTKKPKQSLVDWVLESRANDLPRAASPKAEQDAKPVVPTHATDKLKPSPRYVRLNEWAVSQFSRVPHYNTLIRWVHDGKIQPQPKKIGRSWWVKPEAEHVGDD